MVDFEFKIVLVASLAKELLLGHTRTGIRPFAFPYLDEAGISV